MIAVASAPARVEIIQGFPVVRLANALVELAVVPRLGAKIISLRAMATGREWMWRPPGALRLFANRIDDPFHEGPAVGADECLPTIAACRLGERDLPDHGEAWSAAWTLDDTALVRGEIQTHLRLPRSPFALARCVRLAGAEVILDYTLRNLSTERQPFLWALHPLLTLQADDRLELPAGVTAVRVESARDPDAPAGAQWRWPAPKPGLDLRTLALESDQASAKFFAGPLSPAHAAITNVRTGDQLAFRWSAEALPYAGIWLSRGGWRGAHHVAIEPTNAPCDALVDALRHPAPELFVEAGGERRWQLILDLAPAASAAGR